MTDEAQDVPKRVAIVGTGLSGLTTAHLLHSDEKKRYAVTLFEQVSRLFTLSCGWHMVKGI